MLGRQGLATRLRLQLWRASLLHRQQQQQHRFLATSSGPEQPEPSKSNMTRPKGGRMPSVGWQQYAIEDPVWWNMNNDFKDAHEYPDVFYRDVPDIEYRPKFDRDATYWLSAFFWFWMFYHIYWNYDMITGEWDFPWCSEFTDEELGIPPDNAPDPEYWGDRFKKK